MLVFEDLAVDRRQGGREVDTQTRRCLNKPKSMVDIPTVRGGWCFELQTISFAVFF